MKQLLLLAFISLINPVFSQNWVHSNPVWHYDYWGIGSMGFVKIEQVGDSVIQGKNSMILQTTWYDFQYDEFQVLHFMGPTIGDTNYVYSESDTVFYLQNGQFQKLFDFSKTAGETYQIGTNTIGDLCSSTSYSLVTSTGTDELGNSYIQLDSPDTSLLELNGKYNTRFGGGMYLFPINKLTCDPNAITDLLQFSFKCFQDDDIFYNPSGEDCEYLLTHLELMESEFFDLSIVPNPADNFIVINSSTAIQSIQLVDLTGQIIAEFHENLTDNLDVSNFKSGVYYLKITSKNGTTSNQKISIH
jgi:hypothetical protein